MTGSNSQSRPSEDPEKSDQTLSTPLFRSFEIDPPAIEAVINRTILRQSIASVALLDRQHRFLFVNEGWARLFEKSVEDFVGHPYGEIIPVNNAFPAESELENAVISGKVIRLRSKPFAGTEETKEIAYRDWTIEPIRNEEQQIDSIFIAVTDATERKQTEDALHERERHSQSLLRLSRQLERSETAEEIVNAAFEEVKAVLPYRRLWAYLFSPDMDYADGIVPAAPGFPQNLPRLTIKGDAMLEEIARKPAIVIVEDARTDPRTNKAVVEQLGNRTIVNVPIVLSGRHLGSVGTGSFGEEGIYLPTKTEQEFLSALASSMAVAFVRVSVDQERRKAEAALRESGERYRSLIQKVQAAIVLHDSNGNIIASNPLAQRLLGLSAEQLLGRELIDPGWHFVRVDGSVLPPGEYPASLALSSRQPVHDYVAGIRDPSQDEIRWVLANAHPEMDAQGNIQQVIVSFVDITQLKHTEDALKTSETMYRSLINAMAEGVIFQGADGRITAVNPAAERIEGRRMDQMLGETAIVPESTAIRENGNPFETEQHPSSITLRTGAPQQDVVMGIRRPDGDVRWISINSQPLPSAEGKGEHAAVTTFHDITERRRAEESLHTKQEEFRALVENSPDFIARHDPHARIIYANPALCRMLGCKAADLAGKTSAQITPGEGGGDLVDSRVQEVAVAGHAMELELERHAGGEVRTHHIRFVPEFDRSGKVVSVLSVGRDITLLKQTEQKARQLAAIVESSEDAIIGKTLEGIILSWNGGAAKIYGYSEEEVIGKPVSMLVPRGDDDEIPRILAQIKSGVAIEHYETFRQRKDGRIISMSLTISPIRDLNGKIIAASTIGRDITKRLETEEALRESELKYHQIFDNMTDGMYLIDATREGDFITLEVNPAFERVMGLNRADLVGRRITENGTPPAVAETVLPRWKQCALSGRIDEAESEYDLPAGHRVFHSVLVPMRDISGRVHRIIGIMRDITDRRRAEEERAAHLHFFENLDLVSRAMQRTNDLEQMLREVLETLLDVMDCDRVWLLSPCDPLAETYQINMERTRQGFPGAYAFGLHIPMEPTVAETMRTALETDEPVQTDQARHSKVSALLEQFQIRRVMAMTIRPKARTPYLFGLHRCRDDLPWSPEQERLFKEIGRRLADVLTGLLTYRELQDSEQRFRSFFERNNAVFLLIEPTSGAIVDANPSAARFYGYPRETLCQMAIQDINQLPPELVAAEREHARKDDRNYFIFPHRLADGRIRTVEVHSTPVTVEERSLLFSIIHDITERQEAQEHLRESEERYRLLHENAGIGIGYYRPDGLLLSYNNLAASHMGGKPEDFAGKMISEIFPVEQGRIYMDRIGRCVASERPTEYEDCVFLPGGDRWFYSVFSRVTDSRGRIIGVQIMSQDITDRKKTEEELRRHRDHLEELVAERTIDLETVNRELEAFSYSVSHDLRTPLRAIDGFSRLLSKKYGDGLDNEAHRLISVVRENAAKMARLIDDILAFSRSGRVEMRSTTINMNEIVQGVWLDLEPLRSGRVIEIRFGNLGTTLGDPVMIRQVWMNLLSNAIKFTRDRPIAHIEVGQLTENKESIYFVKDDGVGFDPTYVHKLFGVFQRLHGVDEFDGTGIGLAIVKRIIMRHGGKVMAESQVGKGATFRFTLPGGQP